MKTIDPANHEIIIELFQRDYPAVLASARRNEKRLFEGAIEDAVYAALLEVGNSGRHQKYSPQVAREFRRATKQNLIDEARRMTRQTTSWDGSTVQVRPMEDEQLQQLASEDPFEEALDRATRPGALRELLLPLGPREREFMRLTVFNELSRDEAAEKMGISERAVRKLVTKVNGRLRRFYLHDGLIHQDFADLVLELRMEVGSRDAILADERVQAHLAWCGHCGDLLREREQELRAVLPLLPAAAVAAQSGLFASLVGGGAAASGGGTVLAAGKTVATVCAACGVIGGAIAVEQAVDKPETATAQDKNGAQTVSVSRATALPAPTPSFAVPAVARTEPRVRPTATSTAATKSKNKNSSRRKKKRARSASSRDVETLAGTASARDAAGSRSTAPTASSRQVESSYGVGGGTAPAAAPKPAPKAAPAPAPATRQGCTPGDLGC